MTIVTSLLLGALCLQALHALCPEPAALKDLQGAKICARMFEHSDYYYANSCGGQHMDCYPGEDVPIIPSRWNNRVSSLVVARGCSLTVWSRSKKSGSKRKFSAGIQYHLKDTTQGLFGNWNDDISGYYCVC